MARESPGGGWFRPCRDAGGHADGRSPLRRCSRSATRLCEAAHVDEQQLREAFDDDSINADLVEETKIAASFSFASSAGRPDLPRVVRVRADER
jgi:hypothetical protein